MKNDRIIKAFNSIQPSDEVKKRVFEKIVQESQRKHSVFHKVALRMRLRHYL